MTDTEYRLSWESPPSHFCALMEQQYGKDCWPRVDWSDWPQIEWHVTSVVFVGNERMGQYNTLKQWAETKEQPIRNVTLEKRPMPNPDEGWESASGGGEPKRTDAE